MNGKDVTSIGDLIADPKNARRHNPRNVGVIEDSLQEVGAARSIVIDENNVVLAGNGVLEAAGNVGIEKLQIVDADGETIIAVRRTGLTEAQKKRLALFDNRANELSEWSPDILAQLQQEDAKLLEGLFSDKELTELLKDLDAPKVDDPGPQIDRAAELQEKWGTATGQLWEIPSQSVRGKAHRLLCGDSTKAEDVARLMGGEKAEMMVTDPPYGIGLDTDYSQLHIGSKMVGHTVKTIPFDRVAGDDEPFDASKVQGIDGIREQFWFGADYYAQSLGDTEHGGSWLVWDKRKPSQDDGFGSGFELVWSKQRHKRILLRHEWFGFLSGGNKEATNRMHPTQKPSALYGEIMERWGQRSDIVFDAYVGSGPALVAAEQTGRICYGMEIEPKYIGVCLERLAGMGLEPRLLDATPTAALQEVS